MNAPLKPDKKRAKAERIINTLIDAGFEAYLVGGCVRDQLLGVECPDYDIATSAHPEQVQAIFKRTVAIGASFGVILVMDGDDSFEVATFRSDDRYIDGRRPVSVRFVSAKEDVERRDFTINGLLYDIRSNRVIDYTYGVSDLNNKILRTIGDPTSRFTEDKLRLMRAVRFASRFSLQIEPETWNAVQKLAHQIIEVSSERIRDELDKMLMGPNPHKAMELLSDSGIMKIILPEILRLKGVEQPPEFHPEGDVWQHTMLMLQIMDEQKIPRTKELVWSILLHDVGKPDTFYRASDRIRFNNHNTVGKTISERILKRLKVSSNLLDSVTEAVNNHMAFMNVPNMRVNTLKKLIRKPTFPMELELHKLDCLSSHRDMKITEILQTKLHELGAEKISPPPLITGKDLLKMGYKPGPLFKKILEEVEDQQLLEVIKTEKEATEFVILRFPL
ncbi:MAG: CCA tRNA nucleotidyltransferase [Fibrobacteres bacterium]|nr:CCA tRNA nucleotidyltransferase [Fibrobacterota bacterium]